MALVFKVNPAAGKPEKDVIERPAEVKQPVSEVLAVSLLFIYVNENQASVIGCAYALNLLVKTRTELFDKAL